MSKSYDCPRIACLRRDPKASDPIAIAIVPMASVEGSGTFAIVIEPLTVENAMELVRLSDRPVLAGLNHRGDTAHRDRRVDRIGDEASA